VTDLASQARLTWYLLVASGFPSDTLGATTTSARLSGCNNRYAVVDAHLLGGL